jgi:hypothetical protein
MRRRGFGCSECPADGGGYYYYYSRRGLGVDWTRERGGCLSIFFQEDLEKRNWIRVYHATTLCDQWLWRCDLGIVGLVYMDL